MKVLIMAILLIAFTLILIGCCMPGDNACLKAWYGLEPDPNKPNIYHNSMDLWVKETFGAKSGWQRWWTKTFGGDEARLSVDSAVSGEVTKSNIDEIDEIIERIKAIKVD